MPSLSDLGAILFVGIILAFVVYSKTGGGLGSLNGHPQVPTTGVLKILRTEKEYDNAAHIRVTVGTDYVSVPVWVRDNQLYGPEAGDIPATAASGDAVSVSIDAIRYHYLIDPMFDRLDLGAWAGRSTLPSRDGNSFDVGLRWGVCRFFDDIVATDLVASDHEVGAGVSLHLPADRFPGVWSHLGLGWARVVDFDKNGTGSVVALSFNTR